MSLSQPAQQPFHVMTKPIGPVCNLDCEYCFYLEKEVLWGKGERWKMSDAVLETYIRQYIEAQPTDHVSFAWQGGEPTLLGVDYFNKVVSLQKRYAAGKTIENAFQTNGVLLDEEWGTFFKDNGFLVGVSIDGPEKIHNAYRVDKAGRGTWRAVMDGIRVLQKFEVDFNTLTCVNRLSSTKPELVYKFLKGIGSKYLQFIPIVERSANQAADEAGLGLAAPPDLAREGEGDPRVSPWSVLPRDFGTFLTTIFDRWVRQDVGRVYIQTFDVAFGKWLGHRSGGICYFSETCGNALAIEHNGNVYSCDHYVYPQHLRGNIMEMTLADIADSPGQRDFGQAKQGTLPNYCRQCPWLVACNGECPKRRFDTTPEGEEGLNYLCAAYKQFFSHVDPYFRVMARLAQSGQPPAGVMELLKTHPDLFK